MHFPHWHQRRALRWDSKGGVVLPEYITREQKSESEQQRRERVMEERAARVAENSGARERGG